uniref:Uncharacterized protein n=1 Tax=Lepeophtheirus salmonis TaxID=72036 RepID=A0A0K2TPI5_LEPSM
MKKLRGGLNFYTPNPLIFHFKVKGRNENIV